MLKRFIHHATARSLWDAATTRGEYAGSAQDQADGFIHFSTSQHIVRSVERYLGGRADLVLLSVDPDRLGAALVWEESRDGIRFPHLYAPLRVALVDRVDELTLIAEGRHSFPGWLTERIEGRAGR